MVQISFSLEPEDKKRLEELQHTLDRPSRSAFIAELLKFAVKAWTSNPELREVVEPLTRDEILKLIDERFKKMMEEQ